MTESQFKPVDLDSDIDDLEDLPQFGVLRSGAYRVTLDEGFIETVISDKNFIKLPIVVSEVMELMDMKFDHKLPEPKVGDKAEFLFNLGSSTGQGFFKEAIAPISERTGIKKIRDVMSASKGMEALIMVKTKPDKKDEDVLRMNLAKLSLV